MVNLDHITEVIGSYSKDRMVYRLYGKGNFLGETSEDIEKLMAPIVPDNGKRQLATFWCATTETRPELKDIRYSTYPIVGWRVYPNRVEPIVYSVADDVETMFVMYDGTFVNEEYEFDSYSACMDHMLKWHQLKWDLRYKHD
jgi:hypothetical protein